jgi:hypothetical protein
MVLARKECLMKAASHTPHARSCGDTAEICRSVRVLTVAAPRDRNEPRSALSTAEVQHQLMTFVNVTIDQWRDSACPRPA